MWMPTLQALSSETGGHLQIWNRCPWNLSPSRNLEVPPNSLEINEMSNLRKLSVKTGFENFSLGFYYLDEELEIQSCYRLVSFDETRTKILGGF